MKTISEIKKKTKHATTSTTTKCKKGEMKSEPIICNMLRERGGKKAATIEMIPLEFRACMILIVLKKMKLVHFFSSLFYSVVVELVCCFFWLRMTHKITDANHAQILHRLM